jgi:hypothetical protein
MEPRRSILRLILFLSVMGAPAAAQTDPILFLGWPPGFYLYTPATGASVGSARPELAASGRHRVPLLGCRVDPRFAAPSGIRTISDPIVIQLR